MTRVRNSWARARRKELDDCLRACAVHSGKLVGDLDRRRTELAERLGSLLAAGGVSPAVRTVRAPAPARGAIALLKRAVKGAEAPPAEIDDALLDALLAVAEKALECGDEEELKLALVVSDAVLAERRKSRAGWRLRAQTLDALDRDVEALEAYEQYLWLTDSDKFGLGPRIGVLRTVTGRERELLDLLKGQVPRAQEFAGGRRPATELWAEGLALHAAGDRPRAEPLLVGALLALAAGGATAGDRQDLLSQYMDLRTGTADDDPAALPLLTKEFALYAEQRRLRMRGPLADPTFGGVRWLSLGEFRNQIAGKSVCLISNSGRLGGSSMGSEIDAYDLVVRADSYRIDAEHTGIRTDIHATGHKHGLNWDKPVMTRIVLGGNSNDWKYSLRNRLVPGAQQCVGDESLRWPVRNVGKIGADRLSSAPTSGFNVLWLLDFLDVSPTLDLIGSDYYESGASQAAGALKPDLTPGFAFADEKEWVLGRARSATGTRISLR
ncbi:glycosyltransferase family 29 protein [Streptomyces sp. NPDC058470]|uniref:glycosyltransferase family 29 protein n=1 Tax=Streptomyces sp. NPDC058470 TaxID=3346515 RepID=UPI003648FBDD